MVCTNRKQIKFPFFLLFIETKSTITDNTNSIPVPEITVDNEEQDKRISTASTVSEV